MINNTESTIGCKYVMVPYADGKYTMVPEPLLKKKHKPIDPGETILYRHYDAKNVLLYVGISLSSLRRLGQHSINAHWFKKITTVKMEIIPTRVEALAKEKEAIIGEKPLYNTIHNKEK